MTNHTQSDKRQVNLAEVMNEPPVDDVGHHALGIEKVNQQVPSTQHPRQPECRGKNKPLHRAHLHVGPAVVCLNQADTDEHKPGEKDRQNVPWHGQTVETAGMAREDPNKTKRHSDIPNNASDVEVSSVHENRFAPVTQNPS